MRELPAQSAPRTDRPPFPYFVLSVLAIALVLRLLWVLAFDPQPAADFLSYYAKGSGLAHGEGYTRWGAITAYYLPGYPGFLGLVFAFTGPSLLAAKLANVALQIGSLALLYQITRRLFTSEFTARGALLLFALHPNSIAYCALTASEHLLIFLILLGVAVLLEADRRPWLYAAAGLIFGCAALTRPQGAFVQLIFFALLLLPAIREQTFWRWVGRCALVHAVLGVIVVGWMVRNYQLFHRVLFTTTSGVNLLIGNNPQANGTYMRDPSWERFMPPQVSEDASDLACAAVARRYIHAHPGRVLSLLPRKLTALYQADFDGAGYTYDMSPALTPARKAVLRWMIQASQQYYTLLLAAFLLFLGVYAVCRRSFPRLPTLGLWVIAVFTALYLVYYGMARYHQPMTPWMMMYVAALAEVGMRRVGWRGWQR